MLDAKNQLARSGCWLQKEGLVNASTKGARFRLPKRSGQE
jgi:hypothetical protein